MIDNHFFEKHHKRLVAEGVLRAAIGGVAAGFAADLLVALLAWYFAFGSIWLAIGIGIGTGALCGVLLYFCHYRPTPHEIARRVDRLGLEERLITMMELQDEESVIARLQRENAKEHLCDVSAKTLRFRFSKAVIVLAATAFVLGTGMTTVLGLSTMRVIPSGTDLVNPPDPYADHIALSYIVEEGGEIFGVSDQLLLPGESGTPVVAVPEDGWIFVGWDDGGTEPERVDANVTEELVFTAIFEEIDEALGGDDGDSADGPSDGEGDTAEDAPSENSSGEQGKPGDPSNESSGEGGEGENKNDGQKPSDSQESDGSDREDGGDGASGKWQDNNQFIDGNTYYRDYLDMYYQMAQDIFEADGSIPPELIEFFENYYNSI